MIFTNSDLQRAADLCHASAREQGSTTWNETLFMDTYAQTAAVFKFLYPRTTAEEWDDSWTDADEDSFTTYREQGHSWRASIETDFMLRSGYIRYDTRVLCTP